MAEYGVLVLPFPQFGPHDAARLGEEDGDGELFGHLLKLRVSGGLVGVGRPPLVRVQPEENLPSRSCSRRR